MLHHQRLITLYRTMDNTLSGPATCAATPTLTEVMMSPQFDSPLGCKITESLW
jgi:hypothetical protein